MSNINAPLRDIRFRHFFKKYKLSKYRDTKVPSYDYYAWSLLKVKRLLKENDHRQETYRR